MNKLVFFLNKLLESKLKNKIISNLINKKNNNIKKFYILLNCN